MADNIAVVIVAGEDSTKLGTFNPLAILKRKPLILWTLDIAFEISPDVYILLKNREQESLLKETLSESSAKIFFEPRGVHTLPAVLTQSLTKVPKDLIFLMGDDTPLLNPRLALLLHEQIGSSSAAVPIWANGNIEPFAALYRRASLPQAKISSMQKFLDLMKVKYVKIEELGIHPGTFFKINSKEDLDLASIMMQMTSIFT
jgi:molybdopterin-guanine dinucleotide biosynthesis protein A